MYSNIDDCDEGKDSSYYAFTWLISIQSLTSGSPCTSSFMDTGSKHGSFHPYSPSEVGHTSSFTTFPLVSASSFLVETR